MKKENFSKMIKTVFKKTLKGLSEEILIQIRGWESYPQFVKRLYNLPGYEKTSQKRLYNALSQMKRHGMIEKKIIQDEVFYKLTAKGKTKQLLLKLRQQRFKRGRQATILIFDIPEEKRTFRNFLRRILLQNNFTSLQKSVFITPYILPQEFYDLLDELDLLSFVMVIEGRIRFRKDKK